MTGGGKSVLCAWYFARVSENREPARGATLSAVPRPQSSLVAFWAIVGVAVIFVGDALVQGQLTFFVRSLPIAGLILWALWMILYRPRITFGPEHAVVVNPGRIIEVPWGHATAVRQKLQIIIDLDDGTSVVCWGSPFPDKPGHIRPTIASRRAADVAGPLESARLAFNDRGPGNDPVSKRWDIIPIVVGVALAFATVIDFAVL